MDLGPSGAVVRGTCSLTAVAQDAVRRQIHVTAVASGRNIGAAIGPERYRALGVKDIIQVVDSDGSSDVDRLRARLDELLLGGGKPDAIYVCGSRRLLDLAAELGRRHGARVQVSLEAHMACGLGYCHGCSTGTPGIGEEAPLICKDGPVLDCVNVAAGTDPASWRPTCVFGSVRCNLTAMIGGAPSRARSDPLLDLGSSSTSTGWAPS